MEDLARRGVTFGNPMIPRSASEIAASLSQLARLHAQNWGCGEFSAADRLSWVETAPPFSRPGLKPYLEAEKWNGFVAMPRGAAVSGRFHNRLWAIEALNRIAEFSRHTPNTVIHGDTHLGNVFFERDGLPGFFDIVPRRAPAMSEVCYHITLALDYADRPAWEEDLVRHYLAELRANGVSDAPDFDEAMRQFSIFLVEGFCLVLTNDTYFMEEAPITAYAARFSAAMLDHDTIRLLQTLG
jgi:hypothetical protein